MIFPEGQDADIPKHEHIARLTERHFLGRTPKSASGERKQHLSRRCHVCFRRGIRRESTYLCLGCPSMPALCPAPCFMVYHTKSKYWEYNEE